MHRENLSVGAGIINQDNQSLCSPNLTSAQESVQASRWQDCSSEDLNSSDSVSAMTTAETSSQSDSMNATFTQMSEIPKTSILSEQLLEKSTSSALHRHASPSQFRESEKEQQTSEIASMQSCRRSLGSSPSSSALKTSQDSSTAHTALELQEVTSGIFWATFPSSGTMRNGFVWAAHTLELPSLEKDYCWLDRPTALSSTGKVRPPGVSKAESKWRELGLIGKGEVASPDFLEKLFDIPKGWTSPQESRAAVQLLEDNARQLEIPWIGESHSSLCEESSTSAVLPKSNIKEHQMVAQLEITLALGAHVRVLTGSHKGQTGIVADYEPTSSYQKSRICVQLARDIKWFKRQQLEEIKEETEPDNGRGASSSVELEVEKTNNNDSVPDSEPQSGSFERPSPEYKILSLDSITLDERTQPRAGLNSKHIEDIVIDIEDGVWRHEDPSSALVVFDDGLSLWLAHGFHRYHGYKEAGISSALCQIMQGTLDDAIYFACTEANRSPELKRNDADKTRQTEMFFGWLERKYGSIHAIPRAAGRPKKGEENWSNRAIAKKIGVSAKTVDRVYLKLEISATLTHFSTGVRFEIICPGAEPPPVELGSLGTWNGDVNYGEGLLIEFDDLEQPLYIHPKYLANTDKPKPEPEPSPACGPRTALMTTENLVKFLNYICKGDNWTEESLDDYWGGKTFHKQGYSIEWGGATILHWLVSPASDYTWEFETDPDGDSSPSKLNGKGSASTPPTSVEQEIKQMAASLGLNGSASQVLPDVKRNEAPEGISVSSEFSTTIPPKPDSAADLNSDMKHIATVVVNNAKYFSQSEVIAMLAALVAEHGIDAIDEILNRLER